jgi:peptidoglycan hydrolase FlgJ
MSISIGNTSPYANIAAKLNTSDKTNKLESKLSENSIENASDQELMDVCKSFESYFVEQLFKEMRKTVPETEEKNEYLNQFEDMLYQEYAENVTDNGSMGIAQMLYESMKRN